MLRLPRWPQGAGCAQEAYGGRVSPWCPPVLLFRLAHSATCPREGSPARSATPCAAAPLVLRIAAAPAWRVAARRPGDRAGPVRDVVQVGAADRLVCHRTAGTVGIVPHLGCSGRHQRHRGSPGGQGPELLLEVIAI